MSIAPSHQQPTSVDDFISLLEEDLTQLIQQVYTLAFCCRSSRSQLPDTLIALRAALDNFHAHINNTVVVPSLAHKALTQLLDSIPTLLNSPPQSPTSPDSSPTYPLQSILVNKLLDFHCHQLSNAQRDLDDLVKQLICPHISTLVSVPTLIQPMLDELELRYDKESANEVTDAQSDSPNLQQISDSIQYHSDLVASCSNIITMGTIGLTKKNLVFFDLAVTPPNQLSAQPPTASFELSTIQQTFHGCGRDTDTACLLWPSSYFLSSLLSVYTQYSHFLTSHISLTPPNQLPLFLQPFAFPTTPRQLALLQTRGIETPASGLPFRPPSHPLLTSTDPPSQHQRQPHLPPAPSNTLNVLEVGCGAAALPTILAAKLFLRHHMYAAPDIQDPSRFDRVNIDYSDLNTTILSYTHQHISSYLSSITSPNPETTPPPPTNPTTKVAAPPTLTLSSPTHTVCLSPLVLDWLDTIDLRLLESVVAPIMTTQNAFADYFSSAINHFGINQGNPALLDHVLAYQRNHPTSHHRNFSYTISQLFDHVQEELHQHLSQHQSNNTADAEQSKLYDVVLCSDCIYDGFHGLALPFVFRKHTRTGSLVFCSIGDLIRLDGGYQLIQLFLAMMAILGFKCLAGQLPIFRPAPLVPEGFSATADSAALRDVLDSLKADDLLSSRSSPTFSPEFSFVFIRQ